MVGAPHPRLPLPDGHITVTREDTLSACEKCGKPVTQDEDVLDTWFSSGLWPFSTWAGRRRRPRSRSSTGQRSGNGYDILFFWVARMIMLGIHFMGKAPFSRVLLHGMVVDETGEKMSKVKGNVIDPLDLIQGATFETVVEKALPGAPTDEALKKFKRAYPSVAQMGTGFPAYGGDALRFTLASYSPQAKRIPLSPRKIDGYRHFCNKIWNATRFALPFLEGAQVADAPPPATSLANRWMLSRLDAGTRTARLSIDDFRLDEATQGPHGSLWHELCAWYLELAKPSSAVAARTSLDATTTPPRDARRAGLHPGAACASCTRYSLHHRENRQKLPRPSGRRARWPSPPIRRQDRPRRPRGGARHAALQAIIALRAHAQRARDQAADEVPLTFQRRRTITALLQKEAVSLRTLVKTAGDATIERRGGPRPAAR